MRLRQVDPDLAPPPALRATSPASGEDVTPAWLWVAMLAGAVVATWWAWFVLGFIQEPSAVGRLLVGLLTLIATAVVAAALGLLAGYGLVRNATWARGAAWVAATFITLTGVGAIAGVPALVGLWWSRKAARP